MSFTGKSLASWYKDLFHIGNSNSGVDSTLRTVKSGNGVSSSTKLSKDAMEISPQDNDGDVFVVKDKDGDSIFKTDTTNDLVKAGVGLHTVNTQYAYFGINSVASRIWTANRHFAIPFARSGVSLATGVYLGAGTDPSTSHTIVSTGDDAVNCYWHIPDNITIDEVRFWVGADDSTGDTFRCHLMSYDVDTSNGSTGGDLSNGVVLADGADITSAGYEQAYYQNMTVQSADVDADKVILFAFRSDSINSDYAVNTTIKYHLR
jgi:hypothetical protein